MKIFNLIFCLLFILCAALQYNDPDPYIWIPIYLYAAAGCWFILRQKFVPVFYITGIITFLTYAMYFFFAEDGVLDWIKLHNSENIAGSMKATKPWIEQTREFLGLMIVVVVFTIDYFYVRRQLRIFSNEQG
jgi:hypothetical protein